MVGGQVTELWLTLTPTLQSGDCPCFDLSRTEFWYLKLALEFILCSASKSYVFDLALDAENRLVCGGAQVDHSVVQALVLPHMNKLLPCL